MSKELPPSSILAINAGSSSVKFAAFAMGEPMTRSLSGNIERIGQSGATLAFHDIARNQQGRCGLDAGDHSSAAAFLIGWLERRCPIAGVKAVGHRVVHGMKFSAPMLVTQPLLDELHRISPYGPGHLPQEIGLIETFRDSYPALPQVACFDTAFHTEMPRVARMLPIPRRFDAMGIQRYGFHGLSYAYALEELSRVAGAKAAQGRVVVAHLGSGASIAAIRNGKSVDTSMGFTPAGGLPMGTRPGDLDPGAACHLMAAGALTPKQFNLLINQESGLLGVSETSSDMRDLLDRQADDVRAAEAVELFCYHARKWIGAFAAVLGGIDTLVFSGGIGENAGEVRSRICHGLDFLGIEIDPARNASNDPVISAGASRVPVRVIRTDEEQMIARNVFRMLEHGSAKQKDSAHESTAHA